LLWGREIKGNAAAGGFGYILLLTYIILVIIWVILGMKG